VVEDQGEEGTLWYARQLLWNDAVAKRQKYEAEKAARESRRKARGK